MKILILSLVLIQSCNTAPENMPNSDNTKDTSMQIEQTINDDISLLRSVAEENNLEAFQNSSDSLIAKWQDSENYSTILLEACNNLSSKSFEPKAKSAQLQKQYASNGLFRIEASSIDVNFAFLNHLTYSNTILDWKKDKDYIEQREDLTSAWLKAWQVIENDKIVDFDFDDLPELNVAPPEEAHLMSGVDPKEIEDPELRKQYESDIVKNKVKTENYNYQLLLVDLSETYKPELITYFQKNYSKSDATEVENLLNEYAISEVLKTEILQSLN